MPDVLEGARNLVAGRGYIIVEAMRRGEPAGPYFLRLDKAIDHVVTRAIGTDPSQAGWQIVRVQRHRPPQVVWPAPAGDDGDGEESLVRRRPRRPAGSGAIALPLPDEPHPAG